MIRLSPGTVTQRRIQKVTSVTLEKTFQNEAETGFLTDYGAAFSFFHKTLIIRTVAFKRPCSSNQTGLLLIRSDSTNHTKLRP